MKMHGRHLVTLSGLLAAFLLTGCEDNDSGAGASTEPTAASTYAGTYSGTFSGDDVGTFSFRVANNGTITGRAHSHVYGDNPTVSGRINANGEFTAAAAGTTSEGAIWSGRIAADGSVDGTWNNAFWNMSGTFSGNRN